MAAVFDSAGSGQSAIQPATLTYAVVFVAAADMACIVHVFINDNGGAQPTISSVTVGGAAATLIPGSDVTFGKYRAVSYGVARGSNTGSQTVNVNISGAGSWLVASGAVGVTGVLDQTTPFVGGNSGTDVASPAPLQITCGANDLSITAICHNGTGTPASDQTPAQRWSNTANDAVAGDSATATGTTTHTWSTGGLDWDTAVLTGAAASAGSTISKASPDTTGVGVADASSPVRALISATEAGALVLVELASRIFAGLVAADGAAVTVADVMQALLVMFTGAPPGGGPTNPGADAVGAGLAESGLPQAMLAALDALPLALQEQVVATALVLAADALGIALTDLGAQSQAGGNAFITSSDSGAIALTDAATALVARLGPQDALAVILEDLFISQVFPLAGDTFSVVLGAAFPTLAEIASSDVAALALVDAGITTILGAPVIKLAADVLGISLDDVQTVLQAGREGENVILGLTELAAIATVVRSTDLAAITTADQAAAFVSTLVAGLDGVAPGLVDVGNAITLLLRSADQFGVSLADTGAILVTALVSILASDVAPVQAVELAALVTIIYQAIAAADVASIGSDEPDYPPSILAVVASLDGLPAVLADIGAYVVDTGAVARASSDGVAVVLFDAATVSILGTLLDIESNDALGLATLDLAAVTARLAVAGDLVQIATIDLGNATVILNLLNNILVATVQIKTPHARTVDLVR